MSRHRNVRSLNYEDEYDGYDDVYGHSVEDDYGVSPGTAQQYMFDRSGQHSLSTYMREHSEEQIAEEEEEEESESSSLQESSDFKRPKLSDIDEARLNSCLEEMLNIMGDSTPEHILIDAIVKNDFNYEKAINAILIQQEGPKPQRQKRDNRRNRARDKQAETASDTGVAATVNTIIPQPTAQGQQLPDTVTRMTFTSTVQAPSGFTPDKQDNSQLEANSEKVEAVKKDLNSLMDGATPVQGASGGRGNGDSVLFPPGGAVAESGMLTPKAGSRSASPAPRSATKSKQDQLNAKKELERRKAGGKAFINLVVIGHVDAGKSTLMGHVLYQLGFVNKRTMHKYEQESKKLGKASFAYAWVLDETEEERSRGVTMDVAQTRFETDTKMVTLLDAPGHKDFIPNMITGAAQADVAILVVNSTRGEFETGFEAGGQTREHAMLIRSLGVFQLVVAINKMDTVDWSEDRYKEITKKLGQFLRQAGFKESDVSYIPCSGLSGENLTKAPTEAKLSSWYQGGTVVQAIDKLKPPEREVDKPFRMCLSDVFKGMGAGITLAGNIQTGCVQTGDKVLIMPQAESASVKSITIDDAPNPYGFAGDNVLLVVTGIDLTNVSVGSILCDPSNPIRTTSRLKARVVVFNIDVPLTKGFPVVFHYQSLSEPAHIHKLISQLHKSTGEVIKKKPRCLTKNNHAVIELEINRPVCVELYKDFKDLGRFMLRYGGSTIAAGLVTEIKDGKAAKE